MSLNDNNSFNTSNFVYITCPNGTIKMHLVGKYFAQSAGAVEYTDSFSTEG